MNQNARSPGVPARVAAAGILACFMFACLGAGAEEVPLPGIRLYGQVWRGGALVESGRLVWTYAAPGGEEMDVSGNLGAIIGPGGAQYSFSILVPARLAVSSPASLENGLPAVDDPVSYTRRASVDGQDAVIVNHLVSDTFSLNESGESRRVDLLVPSADMPPEAPSEPIPRDRIVGTSVSTDLDWNDPAFAELYDVYFWSDGESRPETPNGMDRMHSTFDPPGDLEAGRLYYWQVTAKNAIGEAPGPVWRFTTYSEHSITVELIRDYILGIVVLDSALAEDADVNEDGQVDASDIVRLIRLQNGSQQ